METTVVQPAPERAAPSVRIIAAERLLGAARVVVIEHKGERYQLRLTRGGKLILTK